MTVYGILASVENAYDVAGFEDIPLTTAARVIAEVRDAHCEPVYMLYGAKCQWDGTEIMIVINKNQLDEKYTYNPDVISHTIAKLTKK